MKARYFCYKEVELRVMYTDTPHMVFPTGFPIRTTRMREM
jgi:hypothetical protein